MTLGVSERMAPGCMTPSRLCVLLLLGALGLSTAAWSADPAALKETLGKVQSDAESKAVEDLIDKLKGVSRKPASPAAAPATPGAAPGPAAASAPASTPAPAAPSARPSPQPAAPATTAAEPPSQVASPVATEAPTTAPDEAVRRAERKQAPSIDLEIFFEYKSAEITPRAAAALTPLGRALSDARLASDAFLIAGHSDAKGSAEYNLALSQKRAEAVRQFLIANFGIDGKKLVATGMGLKHLKNTKDPLAAENRRVQIVNLSKDQGPSARQR
jgi:outer membrane protein OmpA-like peptidoglycan-associated protein